MVIDDFKENSIAIILSKQYAIAIFITLKTLIGKETKVDGIVTLSTFYLPENYFIRKLIYKEITKTKKTIHFILDELVFSSSRDIDKIEEYLIFNDPFFTKTKLRLNSFEDFFMKRFNKVSFV